jgi:glycosyltransferase involved in cell wall biosynthesis
MRIIQIIDSLEAGGAERMAVNYANALACEIEFSGLVVTRKEGPLLGQIKDKVPYLFLNKKRSIDLKAIFKLRKFVIENKVEIVHAHGTSFFTATVLKFTHPKVKIVWHEHYGARANQSRTDNLVLLFSSLFFSSVFVVNKQLKLWVKKILFTNKVFYIPNFITLDTTQKSTTLKGNDGKRIVCVANLKKPKNHVTLLYVFQEMKLQTLGWSIHLIGKDYNDEYSNQLKEFIGANNLENDIFLYDSKNDIQNILSQSSLGVLCSTDEGFPLSLLEYGLAQLPVVSTNVGYCPEIIKDGLNGLLFDPLNNIQLQQQLQKMICNQESRDQFGLHLHKFVLEKFSREKGMQVLIKKYNTL